MGGSGTGTPSQAGVQTLALTELPSRVMARLGLLDAIDQPQANEYERILDAYRDVLAALDAESLAKWAIVDDIPRQFANTIVKMVCEEVKPWFSLGVTDEARQLALRNEIRKLAALAYVPPDFGAMTTAELDALEEENEKLYY